MGVVCNSLIANTLSLNEIKASSLFIYLLEERFKGFVELEMKVFFEENFPPRYRLEKEFTFLITCFDLDLLNNY